MAQSKQAKQQKALTKLVTLLDDIRQDRARLQAQSYHLIAPSHEEFRIIQEVNNLKRKMGIIPQFTECPF